MTTPQTQQFAEQIHETLVLADVVAKRAADLEKTAAAERAVMAEAAPKLAQKFVAAGMTAPEFEKEAAAAFTNPVEMARVFGNVLNEVVKLRENMTKAAKSEAPKPLGRTAAQPTGVASLNEVDTKWFNN